MAFMMPVMKNNFDIYKDTSRSRKTSECSNSSSTGGGGAPTLSPGAAGGRSRKVSECKSESFASSPSHQYRMQMQRCQSSRAFPRNASRTSAPSPAGALSPTRSFCQASSNSPSKNATSGAGNGNGNGNGNGSSAGSGSQNDLSKFHLRLVDKLRKSFRRDSAKRS